MKTSTPPKQLLLHHTEDNTVSSSHIRKWSDDVQLLTKSSTENTRAEHGINFQLDEDDQNTADNLENIEQETDEVVTTFDYDSDESSDPYGNSPSQHTGPNPQQLKLLSGSLSTPVSPWHDKSRKIRISPLRVLQSSCQSIPQRNLS